MSQSHEQEMEQSLQERVTQVKDIIGQLSAMGLVVGDNEVADIVLPKQDGFPTIKVTGDTTNLTVADYSIKRFKEVLNHI